MVVDYQLRLLWPWSVGFVDLYPRSNSPVDQSWCIFQPFKLGFIVLGPLVQSCINMTSTLVCLVLPRKSQSCCIRRSHWTYRHLCRVFTGPKTIQPLPLCALTATQCINTHTFQCFVYQVYTWMMSLTQSKV